MGELPAGRSLIRNPRGESGGRNLSHFGGLDPATWDRVRLGSAVGSLLAITLLLSFGLAASAGLRSPTPGTSDPGFWWRVVLSSAFAASMGGALVVSTLIAVVRSTLRLAPAEEPLAGLSVTPRVPRLRFTLHPGQRISRWFGWQDALRDLVWIGSLTSAIYALLITVAGGLQLLPAVEADSDWITRRGPLLFVVAVGVIFGLSRLRRPVNSDALVPGAAEWSSWQRTAAFLSYGFAAILLYQRVQPWMKAIAYRGPEPLWLAIPLVSSLLCSTLYAASELSVSPTEPHPETPEIVIGILRSAGSAPGVIPAAVSLPESLNLADISIERNISAAGAAQSGDSPQPSEGETSDTDLRSVPDPQWRIKARLREIARVRWRDILALPPSNGEASEVRTRAQVHPASTPDAVAVLFDARSLAALPPLASPMDLPEVRLFRDAALRFFQSASIKSLHGSNFPLAIILTGTAPLTPEQHSQCRRLSGSFARYWVKLADDVGLPAPRVRTFMARDAGGSEIYDDSRSGSRTLSPSEDLLWQSKPEVQALLWMTARVLRSRYTARDMARNLSAGSLLEPYVIMVEDLASAVGYEIR